MHPMRPQKPWNSNLLTLDDHTARQSRRRGNATRYHDGTLRPDRKAALEGIEALSPRAPLPSVEASSPRYEKPDLPWLWGSVNQYDTTAAAGFGDPAQFRVKGNLTSRHGYSPRAQSQVGALVFGTGEPGTREKGPLDGLTPRSAHLPGTAGYGMLPSCAPALTPAMEAILGVKPQLAQMDLTDAQRVRQLEAELRAEHRLGESARAHLKTYLRSMPGNYPESRQRAPARGYP